MEQFLPQLVSCSIEILCTLIITLIGILGAWLLSKIKQKKDLENIALATEEVLKASKDTVRELQQTLVEGWKRKQNGKLTSEQVEELKIKVIEITSAKLAKPILNLLTSAGVDIQTLISSTAESYILELKKGGA